MVSKNSYVSWDKNFNMPLDLAITSLMNFSGGSFRGKVEAEVRSHDAKEYRNQCKGKKEISSCEGEREKDNS